MPLFDPNASEKKRTLRDTVGDPFNLNEKETLISPPSSKDGENSPDQKSEDDVQKSENKELADSQKDLEKLNIGEGETPAAGEPAAKKKNKHKNRL